jgi:bifunctional NMN adenylyltransferase/nudix hydrolase
MPNERDPIPEWLRTKSITQELRVHDNVSVCPVIDMRDDATWSDQVDRIIAQCEWEDVTLYGSRDCFIPHYHGKHKTYYVDHNGHDAGKDIRHSVVAKTSEDFLSGMIYAQKNKWPVSYQTVDCLVYNDRGEVLLGRKANDPPDQWRLPGGFVDPTDQSLESAAHRELWEEVGKIEVAGPKYIGSLRVHDWRYRSSPDKILTALISFKFVFGSPKAGDDLTEVKWVNYDEALHVLVSEHQPLFAMWRNQ